MQGSVFIIIWKKKKKPRTTNYFTILIWQGMIGGEKIVGSCVSNRQLLTVCHVRIVNLWQSCEIVSP